MATANGALFQRLGEYCQRKGSQVQPIDGYRFIDCDPAHDSIIQRLQLKRVIHFGHQRVAVHAEFEDDDLIIFVGYELLDEYVNELPELGEDVEEIECLPGYAVVLLSSIDIRPRVSGDAVRDFVEAADSSTENYQGHAFQELKRLFPRISIFKARSRISAGIFAQLVTKFSAAESAYGAGSINDDLLREILALASLSAESFPYESVSRAAFDTDPRNLYLALYRCLEATYSYKKSEKLANKLGLKMEWVELAGTLNAELGWRPRESSSLEEVLSYAQEAALRKVSASLNVSGGNPQADSTKPEVSAASAIYDLRNSIVHFNASLNSVDIGRYDWNVVCLALTGVVYDVFHAAFDRAAP